MIHLYNTNGSLVINAYESFPEISVMIEIRLTKCITTPVLPLLQAQSVSMVVLSRITIIINITIVEAAFAFYSPIISLVNSCK